MSFTQLENHSRLLCDQDFAYLSTQISTQQFIFHSLRNPCMLWFYLFYLVLCFVQLQIYSIPQPGTSDSVFIPKEQTTTYTIELLHKETHYHGLLSRATLNFHIHVHIHIYCLF